VIRALIIGLALTLVIAGAGFTMVSEKLANTGRISLTETETVAAGTEALHVENTGAMALEKDILADGGGMKKKEEMLLVGPSNAKEELIIWRHASVNIRKSTRTADMSKDLDIEAIGTGFKYLSFVSDNWIHEKGFVKMRPLPPYDDP